MNRSSGFGCPRFFCKSFAEGVEAWRLEVDHRSNLLAWINDPARSERRLPVIRATETASAYGSEESVGLGA